MTIGNQTEDITFFLISWCTRDVVYPMMKAGKMDSCWMSNMHIDYTVESKLVVAASMCIYTYRIRVSIQRQTGWNKGERKDEATAFPTWHGKKRSPKSSRSDNFKAIRLGLRSCREHRCLYGQAALLRHDKGHSKVAAALSVIVAFSIWTKVKEPLHKRARRGKPSTHLKGLGWTNAITINECNIGKRIERVTWKSVHPFRWNLVAV